MDSLPVGEDKGSGFYQAYLANSSAPLTSFIFTLPLFLVYHGGLWWLSTFAGMHWANAIDIAIADGLGKLGMAGPLLSFLLVVMVFLIMHAMSGKSWHWPPALTWAVMILESIVLALPVFMLSRLVVIALDYVPLSATEMSGADLSWRANLVLSCGAGVYEEFFFRILVMGILTLVLDKVFGIKGSLKFILAGLVQALLFSASHHLPNGPEAIYSMADAKQFIPVFCFRTVAGIYFAFIYVERGFGIAAGSHAGYDLLVVLLDVFMPLEAV